MSKDGEFDAEELDRNSFYWFAEALRILSLDSGSQCREMGSYNTPWELQYDVAAHASLADSSHINFSNEQRAKISRICTAIQKLPNDALAPEGMKMTTYAGCLAGMNHAAWQPFRTDAAQLLASLEPHIKKNQEYLAKSEER